MKKAIKFSPLTLTLVLLGVTVLVTGCSTTAPQSGPGTVRAVLAPYEREQTIGNVRVIILKVERATTFSTDGIRDPQPGKWYPVPTVGVTYMVEALGNEPIKGWKDDGSDDDLMIGNRKVRDDAAMPENLIAGGSDGVFNAISSYGNGPIELPHTYNEKRCVIQENHERAVPLKSNTMRVRLKVGFNDEEETFIFDNIPLN